MTGPVPQNGVRYTLRQVCDAGFLGDDFTPDTLRRAIKDHGWPHTRLGKRYGLTKAHIDAILALGDRSSAQDTRLPRPARRSRRTPAVDLPAGVAQLTPRPHAARKTRRRAS